MSADYPTQSGARAISPNSKVAAMVDTDEVGHLHSIALIRRDADVQSLIGCDQVAITSRLDGSQRIYAVGLSDAYDTVLLPLAGDAASSIVGTRVLLAAIDVGRVRPCSLLSHHRRRSPR